MTTPTTRSWATALVAAAMLAAGCNSSETTDTPSGTVQEQAAHPATSDGTTEATSEDLTCDALDADCLNEQATRRNAPVEEWFNCPFDEETVENRIGLQVEETWTHEQGCGYQGPGGDDAEALWIEGTSADFSPYDARRQHSLDNENSKFGDGGYWTVTLLGPDRHFVTSRSADGTPNVLSIYSRVGENDTVSVAWSFHGKDRDRDIDLMSDLLDDAREHMGL